MSERPAPYGKPTPSWLRQFEIPYVCPNGHEWEVPHNLNNEDFYPQPVNRFDCVCPECGQAGEKILGRPALDAKGSLPGTQGGEK
jgi:hypothetical protein